MLLVIDVGNTNITLGIFDGEKVSGTFRMSLQLYYKVFFLGEEL